MTALVLREKYNPKNDIVFHMLFGKEGNEDLLIDLLEGILEIKILKIDIDKSSRIQSEYIDNKTIIFDIRAKINNGEEVNIEMQIRNRNNMIKRTIFYLSKLYTKQLPKSKDYSTLKRTIVINILDFNLLETKSYHTKWNLREEKERDKILTEDIEVHFIELPKFRKQCRKPVTVKEQWMCFLDNKDEEMIDMAVLTNTNIAKARKQVKITYSDSGMRYIEEMIEKKLYDDISEANYKKRENEKIKREKSKIKKARNKVEEEKNKVEEEKNKVEEEKNKVEEEKNKVEEEKNKIEEEKNKIKERMRLGRIELIKNSLELNMPIKDICKIFKITIEELNNIELNN